ncbi:hypothetical protein CHUAL_011441 [Chamberlinius hualienensis]
MDNPKCPDTFTITKSSPIPGAKSLSNISNYSNPPDKTTTIVTINHEDGIQPEISPGVATQISKPPSISASTHTTIPITTVSQEQNHISVSNLARGGSASQLPLSNNFHSGSRTTIPAIPKTDKSKRSGNLLSSSAVASASAEHKFSTKPTAFKTNRKDVTDVQKMEQGLVQLLDDFHSGQLQAFGKDCSFQKMERIRDQQEKLARLHFDLGFKQESFGTSSKEGCGINKDHITQLMSKLQELSLAIEELHPNTSGNNLQTEV